MVVWVISQYQGPAIQQAIDKQYWIEGHPISTT